MKLRRIYYCLFLLSLHCSLFHEETADIEEPNQKTQTEIQETLTRWVDILDGSVLYRDPSENSPILTKITFRTRLKVLETDKKQEGWEYVEWKSKKGWILQEDISLDPPGSSTGFVPDYLEDLCEGIQNSLECYKAVETKVLQDGVPASRNGTVLTVKLPKEKFLEFTDRPSEGESAEYYNYIDYQSETGIHLVQYSKYEGGHLLGIHDQSGQVVNLLDYPEFSPDGTRIAAASYCPDSNYCENGIQIYKIKPEGLKEEFSVKSSAWRGSDPIWLDDQKISIFFYGNGYMDEPTEKGLIKLKNGKWILIKEGI